MKPDDKFIFYINGRKQHIRVCVYDVSPRRFARFADTYWAFYQYGDRNPYRGLLGELHFVRDRITLDTVAHEIQHLLKDWHRARRRDMMADRNEEYLSILAEEVTRNFWRAWGRRYGRNTVRIR